LVKIADTIHIMTMNRVLSWFLAVFLILGSIFALSFVFAFSSKWNFSFENGVQEKPGYYAESIFSGPTAELDAEKIFGENLTERALNTALSYLMVKNPGGLSEFSTSTVTDFDKGKIRLLAMAEIYNRANEELRQYSESELLTVPDSPAAVKNYLESLKEISDNYLERFRESDLELLAFEASKNNNDDARKEMIDFIDASGAALGEMAKILVPKSWAVFHLGYLNLTSETRYTALGFLLFEDDPVRGNLVFNNYDYLGYRLDAFNKDFQEKFQEYFKSNQ